MAQSTTQTSNLVDFYERRVLPNLFERLDQAFPEIRWTRTTNGWLGEQSKSDSTARRLVCNQPWGFTAQDGESASWLTYANGGTNPTGEQLVKAVRKLAALAGVSDTIADKPLTKGQQYEAQQATRYRELLEAFSAYANACLFGPIGKHALDVLREDYGIRPDEVATTPLGVYTTAEDIEEYLKSVGFSHDEIEASYVTRDSRLSGRITIPWRDAWGNLKTVVACDLSGKSNRRGSQLFLRGSSRPEFFGLDVALREASGGRQNLMLASNILEVVVCHARGLRNVAACGNRTGTVSGRQWKTLASHGIARATLALGDQPNGWEKTEASLNNWLDVDCPVQPFALAPGALGTTPMACGYARSNGNGRFLEVSQSAPHGCTYLANQLITKHATGVTWQDSAVVELLTEAIEVDARATELDRVWSMQRFFWPTILKALELDWHDMRGLLRRKRPAADKLRAETERIRECKLLARDLTEVAQAHDVERFEAMILAAADEIRRGEKKWSTKAIEVETPPILPTPPVLEDHWQETIVEAPPVAIKTVAAPVRPIKVATNGRTEPKWHPTDDDIRRRAYLMWESAGYPTGQHDFFWQEAERQILAEGRNPTS